MRLLSAVALALAWGVAPAAAQDRCADPRVAHVTAAPERCAEVTARYDDATARYPHGILDDALEWGALVAETGGARMRLVLPTSRVFEDIAPRIADLDGRAPAEIIVVESDAGRGAQLAVYRAQGGADPSLKKVAATPHIGTRFRWLAPAAIADLDGDGRTEIAYVDRPHLAKVLRVWRFEADRLTEIAQLGGVTNHRIGDALIAGGLRQCGEGPEIILADAAWARLLAVRFTGGQLTSRDLGPYTAAAAGAALACRD